MNLVQMFRYLLAPVVVAGVWEAAARMDDYVSFEAPLLEPYSHAILYTNDALGKCGKPYARYVKWRFNGLGYRSPELDPRRVQIITVGASETFGLYETENREYPRRLEAEINGPGEERYQVMNVAFPGLSNKTAIRRLPVILSGVRPRVAVIYPSLANYIELPVDPNAIPMADPVSRYELRIADKIKKLLKSALPEWVQTQLRSLEIEKAIRGKQVLEHLPEGNVVVFRRELGDLVDGLVSQGVKPLLVTHATRFGAKVTPEERSMLVAWRKFYPTLAEGGFLEMENRLNAVIREEAATRGLAVADAARLMPVGPRYFADFVHLTDDGAQAMAKIIGDPMKQVLADLK